jgi:hypothetical protein
MKLIEAIARMEGFGADPANLPTRHNNPGDICAGQWANAHGAVPGAEDPRYPGEGPSRYAMFKSQVDGWDALRTLLNQHYAGMTLASAISKYAPATENDTDRYITMVCQWTGLTPLTVLTAENIG